MLQEWERIRSPFEIQASRGGNITGRKVYAWSPGAAWNAVAVPANLQYKVVIMGGGFYTDDFNFAIV